MTTAPDRSAVSIQPYQDIHLKGMAKLRASFLNSKHFFCLLPMGLDSENELRKYYGKNPELKSVAAVATVDGGAVVGFCQLVLHGMPCDLHEVEPGECYVYMVAVAAKARGRGVGSALLRWADDAAAARDCDRLTLEVLGGNPAIGLYERKGFVVREKPLWRKVLGAIPVCCFVGPVICTAGSSMYCNCGQVIFMEKRLGGGTDETKS